MLGYDKVGAGPLGVVVLNDWLCDTSTWDGARAYLDLERFTYAFTDLRGYGRSRGQKGSFTVAESAADVLGVAEALDWKRFAIVGHSMSTLVALHLAQQHAERIARGVVLTPPPPAGLAVPDAVLEYLRSMANGDDALRFAGARRSGGERLTHQWTHFKVARWRAAADAEAVAGYARMFARAGMPDSTTAIAVPILAVTGEQDAEMMRREAVTKLLAPLCTQLTVTALTESGHYPMQETPPLLVAIMERFLGAP